MGPFNISLMVLAVSIAASFIAGAITRNYSHVDRLWSILPPVYVIIWSAEFGKNAVYWGIAVPVILWGIRLTANFARRGGYAFDMKRGFYGEDYRWEFLRNRIPDRLLFELFNLLFISFFQLTLIFHFTLPVYYAGKSGAGFSFVHLIIMALHLTLLAGETVADNQQFEFHKRKREHGYGAMKEYQAGFNTSGLWRISRHPNYFCELGQWILVWAYTAYSCKELHASVAGAAILVLLFAGSTAMTESLTASKYPLYVQWQKATPPWIPFIDRPLRKKARINFWDTMRG